ncbi:metal ABC transporter substrate-binding protein [Litorihabitans aurantiacus]|uniref:Zinc ABC transporter substrate-binding protein n=1 Tax=Litorihabitans aurantiacus TaxID=1930061 RepID=A0AA37UV39_9MICO|nr:metal ABC transporter substrate-binding protein [Litorihabitans aurantiacus]GMA30981.1 zinc ABC transporter substrate-binding protein [Litorihabitans aurantiacus]
MQLRFRRALVPISALALALPLAACGDGGGTASDAAGDTVDVLASFYPLQYLTQRVGGDAVTVSSLTPAGAEPHDLELSPAQVASVGRADLVVYLSGFQPAVDTAVTEAAPTAIDVAGAARLRDAAHEEEHDHEGEEEGHDHGTLDPHFWLDPIRMADAADAVAAQLSEVDPDGAADFEANAATLRTELEGLDGSYRTGLAQCETTTIVVAHEAYGYLATAYGLEQEGISGIDPDAEPSPARLREIEQVVRDTGVNIIFTESLIDPRVAEVLAGDLGITTGVLDPLENQADPEADYLDVMESNLASLRDALTCA